MRAFITRRLPEEALRIVREAAEINLWEEELPPPPETLRERLQDADALLCLLTDRVDESLLAAAPNLRVVSQMAVGYDNIDVAACTRYGIPVGNTPGVLTETTADLTFALLLATARRVVDADRYTRSGAWETWSPMLLTGQDVHHATLGIIGMGRIGFEVARRAHGFQMQILYTGHHPNEAAEREFGAEFVPLDALLKWSDFVTIHTPLTAETRHLMGAAQFAKMKPTAIFINTARGQVVHEDALYEALKRGFIAGAGLDVYEVEPLPRHDPLLHLENVVVLPHIGSASVATRTRMAVLAAENLVAGLAGKPLPYLVNPDVTPRFTA